MHDASQPVVAPRLVVFSFRLLAIHCSVIKPANPVPRSCFIPLCLAPPPKTTPLPSLPPPPPPTSLPPPSSPPPPLPLPPLPSPPPSSPLPPPLLSPPPPSPPPPPLPPKKFLTIYNLSFILCQLFCILKCACRGLSASSRIPSALAKFLCDVTVDSLDSPRKLPLRKMEKQTDPA